MKQRIIFIAAICSALVLALATAQPAEAGGQKLKFKYPKKLDMLMLKFRCPARFAIHPVDELVSLGVFNDSDPIYAEEIEPGNFVSNKKGSVFKYKLKKTGSPMT
jgi:hypothetical protein